MLHIEVINSFFYKIKGRVLPRAMWRDLQLFCINCNFLLVFSPPNFLLFYSKELRLCIVCWEYLNWKWLKIYFIYSGPNVRRSKDCHSFLSTWVNDVFCVFLIFHILTASVPRGQGTVRSMGYRLTWTEIYSLQEDEEIAWRKSD